MNFKFQINTKVIFGVDCVAKNAKEFRKYGKRALIVTGTGSAKRSGALGDVVKALREAGVEHAIYDKIENNPALETVKDGGRVARNFKVDFVIGIGGGSPLDASKAIAVLAANDIDPLDLYKNTFKNKPLAILAIPTTAGTGSEVTPYSILTRKDMETKKSFGNQDLFPAVAFMDARYTESMPCHVTVNTAVDALSHAVEGYLSKRSTPVSDMLAVESIELFGKCLKKLTGNNIDFDAREQLLYMSMLAGMVIAHTGTTIVHAMGYSLTYYKDIPHGMANGLLMKEYLSYNYDYAESKVKNVLKLLKLKSVEEFGAAMDKLVHTEETFSEEELRKYATSAIKQNSVASNIRDVAEEDMVEIMRKSLL